MAYHQTDIYVRSAQSGDRLVDIIYLPILPKKIPMSILLSDTSNPPSCSVMCVLPYTLYVTPFIDNADAEP
jgi:hypothetical protein